METLNMLKAKTRVDYKETLLAVPPGETRAIKVTARTYNGLTVAASRLFKNQGIKFTVETDDKTGLLKITRQQ